LVVSNCFFKIANAFLGTFEKPTGAGHVGVDSSQAITGWMVADEFKSLLKVFQACFVVAFMYIRHADAKIRLSQTTPFARLAEVIQGSLGVVARNRVFADAAIDAGERRINHTGILFSVSLRKLTQGGFED